MCAFPQKHQGSKYCFFSNVLIVKFENWKTAFPKYGKFEKRYSKNWNIRKIGS